MFTVGIKIIYKNLPAEYCTESYSWNTPCCHCFHVLLFCGPLTMERGQCGHLTGICLQSHMLQAALFLQLFHSLGFPWTTFGTSYQNKCYTTASISEVFFKPQPFIYTPQFMLTHHWKCKRASLVLFVCSWVLEKHGSATQSTKRREPVPSLESKVRVTQWFSFSGD